MPIAQVATSYALENMVVENKTQRVLHIITDLGDGGAQSVLYSLCKADPSTTHIVVSMRASGKYGDILRKIGVRVELLEMSKLRPPFGAALKLYRLIKSSRPELVQTWMYHANMFGGLVARAAGAKHICWGIFHATLSRQEMRWSTRLVVRIGASLSRIVPGKIIICAEAAVAPHAAIGYERSRLVVVPSGFDLKRFAPNPQKRNSFRKELGIADAVIVLGSVARMHPAKDHTSLLDALEKLVRVRTDVLLLLVGTRTDGPEMAKEIRQRGLQGYVRALGPRYDVPEIMNGIDVHVMSSVTEGFPSVLCEAMSCGTPCVATDVGDARKIVGEDGWIVPAGDPQALSQALDVACQTVRGPHAAELSQRVRMSIEDRFTVEGMVSRYHTVWASMYEYY